MSDEPQPEGSRGDERCAHCGAAFKSFADPRCWLCGHERKQAARYWILPEKIVPCGGEPPSAFESGSTGDNATVVGFWLLAALVCFGLLLTAPGLLIVLAVLATPALARTAYLSWRAKQAGERRSRSDTIVAFLASLGTVVVVGSASVIAFFATCFAVCFGWYSLAEKGGGETSIGRASYIGLAAGVLVGLSAAFLMFWALWRRRT